MTQLELFDPADFRRQLYLGNAMAELHRWPAEIWRWRHAIDSTGWSMAVGIYTHAEVIQHFGGFQDPERFDRLTRFYRRLIRYETYRDNESHK